MNFHNPNPMPFKTMKPLSHAQRGKKAKGVPKPFTEAERERRRERMEALNARRKKAQP